MGFFSEHGPLITPPVFGSRPPAYQLSVNANAWALQGKSRVLYVDSPVGVGYSWSEDTSDYNTDDNTTAIRSAAVLDELVLAFSFPNSFDWITLIPNM